MRLSSGILLFLLLTCGAEAEVPPLLMASHKRDSSHVSFIRRCKEYKQLDLIDIVRLVLNRRLMAASDSLHKNEKLHIGVLPAPGYTQSTGVVGIVSANFAFFVNDKHNLNQSDIEIEASYTQYNQAVFRIRPNVWTRNDAWSITGDNRFIKYPQETFGLGGNTLPSQRYVIDYFLGRARETLLRHVVQDLYIGFGYDLDYHFNIRERTDSSGTDYKKYGGGRRSVSSGPKIEMKYDNRRNAINPSAGFFASIIFTSYLHYLGSDVNYLSLKGDFRYYLPLDKKKRHILALWNYDWFTFNGHAPYLDLPATAWDDNDATGRGYVQSRFRGKNMIDFEGEYRFPILKDGFFGGVIFANVESVTDYPSNRFTTFQPGWGLGLRVKLNKASGTNLCFDYGFGLHHSNDFIINLGELF